MRIVAEACCSAESAPTSPLRAAHSDAVPSGMDKLQAAMVKAMDKYGLALVLARSFMRVATTVAIAVALKHGMEVSSIFHYFGMGDEVGACRGARHAPRTRVASHCTPPCRARIGCHGWGRYDQRAPVARPVGCAACSGAGGVSAHWRSRAGSHDANLCPQATGAMQLNTCGFAASCASPPLRRARRGASVWWRCATALCTRAPLALGWLNRAFAGL